VNTLGIPLPLGSIGDESTPFNWEPYDFHYAITKKKGEEIALAANGPQLQVVAVNPGTMFGPGDININAGSYILTIARSPVFFYPTGGCNCVHVDAVVAGHLAAYDRGRPGERYILGGENLTFQEIFTLIAEVLHRPRPRMKIPYALSIAGAAVLSGAARGLGKAIRLSPEAVRVGRFELFYSSSKAVRELALPQIPFRIAIEDAVRWYRENGYLPGLAQR
jgi:dihydroflavonol-4-reductase